MDYTGYTEFPFPSVLSAEDEQAKKFFLDLPDEEQLKLLNLRGVSRPPEKLPKKSVA